MDVVNTVTTVVRAKSLRSGSRKCSPGMSRNFSRTIHGIVMANCSSHAKQMTSTYSSTRSLLENSTRNTISSTLYGRLKLPCSV